MPKCQNLRASEYEYYEESSGRTEEDEENELLIPIQFESSSPSTLNLSSDNFLTQNEWVRRSQGDPRLPFCNLLGKK